MSDPKMKIEFAPGVLEEMEAEMSTEELQDLLDHLKELVESGNLEENSSAVDMEDLAMEDPELFAILQERRTFMEDLISNTKPTKPTLH